MWTEYNNCLIYKGLEVPFEDAKNGNIDKVKEYISSANSWVNIPDEKGNTLLFYAGKRGHVNVVTFLLEKGASVYENIKGKSLWDKAPQEVMTVLENHSLNALQLFEKVYSNHLALSAEKFVGEKLNELKSIVQSLSECGKKQVAYHLFKELLVHGEIESAKVIFNEYQKGFHRSLLSLLINNFEMETINDSAIEEQLFINALKTSFQQYFELDLIEDQRLVDRVDKADMDSDYDELINEIKDYGNKRTLISFSTLIIMKLCGEKKFKKAEEFLKRCVKEHFLYSGMIECITEEIEEVEWIKRFDGYKELCADREVLEEDPLSMLYQHYRENTSN